MGCSSRLGAGRRSLGALWGGIHGPFQRLSGVRVRVGVRVMDDFVIRAWVSDHRYMAIGI